MPVCSDISLVEKEVDSCTTTHFVLLVESFDRRVITADGGENEVWTSQTEREAWVKIELVLSRTILSRLSFIRTHLGQICPP